MTGVILFWLICSLSASTQQNLLRPKWKEVFKEDFNGTKLDLTKWNPYNSPGHDKNGLRRPEAFSVANGLLTVTAEMIDGNLVSGGMAHRANYKYGKFEFKVRAEPDSSAATSAVILTWPESEQWPVDGENDIYETLTNASRKPFHTFIHYDKTNKQHHFQHDADAKEWHVIAMEWSPDSLIIYRDGQPVYTLTDKNAIPQVPHHLCIQLDAFKKTMAGKVKMYVDWVRIYQLNDK
jgi:beta-glucanase (GH16 family)